MKRLIVAALLSSVLSACIVVPGRHGPEVIAVPPLPQIVELLDDAFYVQSGYWYYYNGGDWRYGRSRNGPWVALPRDRYPREVRWRNRGEGNERRNDPRRGREEGRGQDQGRDQAPRRGDEDRDRE